MAITLSIPHIIHNRSCLHVLMPICRSLGSLSVLFGQVVKGLSSGSRVFQYIASPLSSPLRGGHTLPAEEVRGRVEFRDVQFSYPNRPNQVLRNGPSPPPPPYTHTHTHMHTHTHTSLCSSPPQQRERKPCLFCLDISK